MLIPIFARLNVFERLIEIDDPQWLVSTSKVLAKITFKVNNCTSIFYFDRKPCCLLAGWTPMKCQFNCGRCMTIFFYNLFGAISIEQIFSACCWHLATATNFSTPEAGRWICLFVCLELPSVTGLQPQLLRRISVPSSCPIALSLLFCSVADGLTPPLACCSSITLRNL